MFIKVKQEKVEMGGLAVVRSTQRAFFSSFGAQVGMGNILWHRLNVLEGGNSYPSKLCTTFKSTSI